MVGALPPGPHSEVGHVVNWPTQVGEGATAFRQPVSDACARWQLHGGPKWRRAPTKDWAVPAQSGPEQLST
jgi:hypothetical protein